MSPEPGAPDSLRYIPADELNEEWALGVHSDDGTHKAGAAAAAAAATV